MIYSQRWRWWRSLLTWTNLLLDALKWREATRVNNSTQPQYFAHVSMRDWHLLQPQHNKLLQSVSSEIGNLLRVNSFRRILLMVVNYFFFKFSFNQQCNSPRCIPIHDYVFFLLLPVSYPRYLKSSSYLNLKLNLRHLKPQGSNIFWKSEECSSLRLTLTVDIAEVVTELQPVRCIAKKTVNRSIRLQHYLQIVRLYKCIKVKMKSKVVPTYAWNRKTVCTVFCEWVFLFSH